ncbi:hypothetical protein GETHLI_26470 [Geothrix limicola]|uniref:Phage baseplate assembly protein n=1 Tax=Geothrix limicola TaxID=2927978 RepID=A0ABQ5QIF2_9BACT|nr:hypothetical protein [Geothrix limicola]GLH74145.1 hypothetical protein GETHLI_26470 [Geothrix limicola]
MSPLYELLPVIHQRRDAEQGYPLKQLMAVLDEQVGVVRQDIAQLYANWFIETCQDWAVPYLGDLVGYEPVHEAGEPGPVDTREGRLRNRFLIPRRAVANAVRDRRRKGTLAILEDLSRDVADWPARAVEFYKLLAWNQHLNHQRLWRGGTADLRRGEVLDLVDGPFDRLAHTVDVRRIDSGHGIGRFNIPSVGLYVWRLGSYPVTETPAYCLEEVGSQCYLFSVLGNDTPLFNKPQPEPSPTHIADELNLPVPIRRRAFESPVLVDGKLDHVEASTAYYAPSAEDTKSLAIWAPDWPKKGAPQPLPAPLIVPADLTDWTYRTVKGTVAVDPVLGRIVFPTGQLPKRGVRVSYRYGFSADMGGGEYRRTLRNPLGHKLYRVGANEDYTTLLAALGAWMAERADQPTAVVEVQESGVYTESLNLDLRAGESLQIRGASGTRPVLRLLDLQADMPDAFSVTGARGSRFSLDGFIVTGRGLRIYGPDPSTPIPAADAAKPTDPGDLCEVALRHCTLVPGWGLQCDCDPKHPNEASLELDNTQACIRIEHCILGSIYVVADEVKLDPVSIHIRDSIVDATSDDRVALGSATLPAAYARVSFIRSTVFGQVQTHAIELAENSLFTSTVRVARRQVGCMRFCHVPSGSRTPRRYHCQPDLAIQALGKNPPPADVALAREQMAPRFMSRRYGQPAYGQLAEGCAQELRRGADDESEMGAFHDLFQPQRAANLRVRLDEFTPAGMEAGILFAN